jgi:ribosomal protein L24E
MLDVREDLVLIDSTHQPAGACAACGQPIAAGEGITALYGGRLLRFRCSGCLDSFRRDPRTYAATHDYCCSTETCCESPATEWAI